MSEQLLSEAARDVLAGSRVEENILYLPPQQLARPLYEEVNEALTRLGGKWKGGKVKGHVFESDPSSDLAVLVQTGLIPPKNPMAFFSTPPPVIDWMLHYLNVNLELRKGMRFLEPSAGKGAIALALRKHLEDCRLMDESIIHVCEIQPTFAQFLRSEGFEIIASDFLAFTPDWTYDAILMNPPFSIEGDRQAYITHILHAWEMLTPGGVMISIAPPGFTMEGRREKKLRDFLTLVEDEGRWDELPDESFKESGTGIKTVILLMKKSMVQPIRSRKDVPVFGDYNWIKKAKKKVS